MARIDMWLDDDDVKEGMSSGRFLLTPPDDAVKRGNLDDPKDLKARASWVQHLEIIEAKMYQDSTKDKDGVSYPCVVIEVNCQVPPDALRPTGVPDPNAGRQLRSWYRIVPEAMKNRQHPKFKANNFAHGKAMAILRSIWGSQAFPQGTKVNLGDFYGAEDGANPPVVGRKIVGNIEQSKYEGKPKDELTDLVPLELQ